MQHVEFLEHQELGLESTEILNLDLQLFLKKIEEQELVAVKLAKIQAIAPDQEAVVAGKADLETNGLRLILILQSRKVDQVATLANI